MRQISPVHWLNTFFQLKAKQPVISADRQSQSNAVLAAVLILFLGVRRYQPEARLLLQGLFPIAGTQVAWRLWQGDSYWLVCWEVEMRLASLVS